MDFATFVTTVTGRNTAMSNQPHFNCAQFDFTQC
ncbi:MAG: hypothetical protein ACI9LG_002963, partial [Moritella dasanensis]